VADNSVCRHYEGTVCHHPSFTILKLLELCEWFGATTTTLIQLGIYWAQNKIVAQKRDFGKVNRSFNRKISCMKIKLGQWNHHATNAPTVHYNYYFWAIINYHNDLVNPRGFLYHVFFGGSDLFEWRLIKCKCPEFYHTVIKSESILNIPFEHLLEKKYVCCILIKCK